jgi:hypothetical protein
MGGFLLLGPNKIEQDFETLLRRQGAVIGDLGCLGLLKIPDNPDGSFHTDTLPPNIIGARLDAENIRNLKILRTIRALHRGLGTPP